jgi:hypothetical protein
MPNNDSPTRTEKIPLLPSVSFCSQSISKVRCNLSLVSQHIILKNITIYKSKYSKDVSDNILIDVNLSGLITRAVELL